MPLRESGEVSCHSGRVSVVLCPGQGSQRPGMLTDWIASGEDRDLNARTMLQQWSNAADLDLIALGCEADAETIRDTAVAQPLIVATSLLSWRLYQQLTGAQPSLTAGHSVGELAALAVAGVISDADAVALAAIRGRAMAAAAAQESTSMAAVIGGDREGVLAALAAAGLTPANINGSSQVVAAGPSEAIAELVEHAPAGTRVKQLAVAGAFHTMAMADAVPAVATAVAGLTAETPICPIISNRDGAAISDGSEALGRIPEQITQPVRWDLCQDALASAVASTGVELAPAGVLRGLIRRDIPTLSVTALTPAALASAGR